MAISYEEYKKKYNEDIKNYQNKYNALRKMQVTNSTNKNTTNKSTIKKKNNQKTQELLKERQREISSSTYTETKPSSFITDTRTPNITNNFNKITEQLNKIKNYSKNDELKQVVKDNYKPSIIQRTGQTTLNTVASGTLGILKGGARGLEKIHDNLSDASNKVNLGLEKLVGLKTQEEYDETRKKQRKRIAKDHVSEFIDNSSINKVWDDLEKDSLIKRDNLGGKIAEGIGEMLPTIAIGKIAGVSAPKLTSLKGLSGTQKATTLLKNVGKTAITQLPTNTTLAMSSYGGALEEAYANGATDNEAMKYALSSTATELTTEWITGGIPGVNDKGLLDSLQDKALDKVSNNLAKFLIKSGYSVIGEGTEEALTEMINPILKNATYSQGEKVDWNSVVESAIIGGITGGILNTPANISSYRADVNSTKLKQQQISNQSIQNFIEQNNIKPTQINTNEISLPKIETTNPEVNVQQNLEKLSTKNNINLPKTTNTDSDIFSKQVDEVVNGTFPRRDMLVVSQNTPQVLQDIGLNNLPITMTQKHLNTIMNSSGQYKDANYHDLGIDIVKQLPRAIADPLNVLKSNTKDDSIVVVTDLADNQERPIIASIKIDGKGQINSVQIDTNVMTSAYGRSNYDKFMQDNIANGNLLYDIDEGIIKKSDTTDRVQFPMRGSSSSTTTSDIPKNISPISYDNNTTNSTKSQIAPLPSQYSMQQNVENDTKISTNEENKIAQLLDKRPSTAKPTLQDSAYKTIRELVDKGEAISRLAKKSGNKELYAKYDHMGTAEAEGNYAIAIAQTDNNGNKIGKSIMEIWKPVEDANLVEEFSNYLLHKHNISRWQQGKPVFGEEVTSDISKKFVEESEKKYSQFTEWSKDINTYNKNQMQNMVDAGLTSKESQEYFNSTYDNYVRIYRDVRGNSPITQFRGNLKVNVPIKRAKGGNQDILPLKDSMAQQTIETKKAIRRNEFGLELLNVLNNGENVEYDGKQQVVKNDDGTYSFTIFKDGQPIKMEIDEGIYEALEPKKTYNIEKTLPFRAIQKVSQIQRGLLTDKNPLFIATNFFKDIGDASFNSKYASKFAKNYVVAANEIKNKGELWNKYRALGGEQNTYFDYESGIKLPSNSKVSKFIRKIQSINQIVEQLPRFTEFISTLEAGGTEAQAMYNAAEITTNFKRGGDFAKALNRNGANFLNASIQGFDKQIRNFTGQNGVKGYVNLLAKATILGVLPSVLNHLLLDDDEDYQELPDYIKDSYYLFKTGDGKFIRIPKGRVVSTFGMTARRTLEYADGEKDAYDGMFTQMANQVAPNNPLEDNVYAPIKSVMTNKSWNGSEIVPTRLQDELPENQYDEKTDAISKFIGKTFKVSPKKVNYLLDQYTGAIGDIVLPYITPQARQNPISAKFTTDSVLNNKNVSDFYDIKDELTAKSNSTTATTEDKLKTKYLNSIGSEMNELYKEKREIQNSSLNNDEKYKEVKKIQEQINELSKKALSNYENVSSYSNYGKVADKEYYLNSKNEWTKVDEEEQEALNKLNMSDDNKNIYFTSKVKIGVIKNDKTKDSSTKHKEINNILIDSNLEAKEKAYLYEKYYSSEETINSVINAGIDFNEFLKYDMQDFEGDFNTKTGKTVSGSRQNKIINYVNSLNLSIPQKALLIKMEYKSYKKYDKQIAEYVNSQNISFLDKAQILKKANFTSFDKQIINYVNSQNMTIAEKIEILEELGFTVKNGRVY